MDRTTYRPDALLLEDFDIRSLAKLAPQKEIGVNVNRIYSQIAKISGNPRRNNELQILVKAISSIKPNKGGIDPVYIPMKMDDVALCFSKRLKTLPKNTFIDL